MARKVIDREFDMKSLDKAYVNNEPVRRFIRKLNVKGVARCDLCQKEINYGGRRGRSLE